MLTGVEHFSMIDGSVTSLKIAGRGQGVSVGTVRRVKSDEVREYERAVSLSKKYSKF